LYWYVATDVSERPVSLIQTPSVLPICDVIRCLRLTFSQKTVVISHIKPATTETFRDKCGAQNSGKRYTLYDAMLLATSNVIFWVEVHLTPPI